MWEQEPERSCYIYYAIKRAPNCGPPKDHHHQARVRARHSPLSDDEAAYGPWG